MFTSIRSSLVVVTFLVLALQARAQVLVVTGKVHGSGRPLEYANVLMYVRPDSIKVAGFATADSTGLFTIRSLAPGSYWMKVQRVGFLPQRKELILKSDVPLLDAGIIDLDPDKQTLQGITVTAPRKMIQKTPQGFVVIAEANLTSAGGTATDLLANAPTVLVDEEGAITLRGKSPQVLINGRVSSLTSHNLDRIPASSIDRIEIINNPGAKYDADAEGGVVNIILKKNTKAGTNGAFALGAGYGAKYRVNSSLLLSHQVNTRLNLGLSYDNRFAGRKRWIDAERENFHIADDHYLIQHREDDRTETTHNLKFNTDYAIDKRNSIGFEGIYSYDGQHNMESLTSTLEKQDHSFHSANNRFSDEIPKENVVELTANYERKFKDNRKGLTASVSTDIERGNEHTNITTKSLDLVGKPFGDPYLQQTHNLEKLNFTTGRLDYAFPVSERGVVETGYRGLYRTLNADFRSLYEQGGAFIPDPRASNVFDYKEQNHAGYVQFRSYTGTKEEPRLKYELGMRVERLSYHGQSTNSEAFSKQYLNFFPTATLAWYMAKESFIKFNYGRRINRPGLGMLNPFVDITDSLNPHSGNPYLEPELVNALELGYNHDWHHFNFTLNAFYRRGTNTIMNYVFVDSAGKALSKPINIGSNETYGLESILGFQAGTVWQANASLSLYQQNLRGEVNGEQIRSDAFTWYVKTVQNFSLWKGGKLQVVANYQAPLAVAQGKRIAVYNVDMGFQQRILNNKGRIGVTVTDVFNTMRNGYNLYTTDFTSWRRSRVDSRAVIVTFAYTFGTAFKEKLMENKYSND
jgi:outer membrane cobalamin receptor